MARPKTNWTGSGENTSAGSEFGSIDTPDSIIGYYINSYSCNMHKGQRPIWLPNEAKTGFKAPKLANSARFSVALRFLALCQASTRRSATVLDNPQQNSTTSDHHQQPPCACIMPAKTILNLQPLGFPWATIDPFLFCVYHDDAYPRGNAHFGPDASLAGRDLGQDFAGKDGWRMYHGLTVPGFPSHPHRGFETVTIVRKGLIDHSDSLGATARFGGGDVQWLTAGKGIVHSEMFPLLNPDAANPLELFQIWLNLPAKNKMVDPHFTMFWSEKIPRRLDLDANGKTTEACCIAGRLGGAVVNRRLTNDALDDEAVAHTATALPLTPPPPLAALSPLSPPPDSWASQTDADVAIWTLKMAPGARWTLPAAATSSARRQLYFFKGVSVTIAGQNITEHAAIELAASSDVALVNGPETSEFLLLQGKPIDEPVAQYGPFVMNTQAEIHQAFADYRATEFGGWPWPDNAPVHGAASVRFAKHADGKMETLQAQNAGQ